MELINKQPPQLEWVKFDKKNPVQYALLYWGCVNIGSPHECFAVFKATYEGEFGFLDDQGDDMDCVQATHYLKLKE